tara:strand:+ start:3293 stop:3460 length:168 start_codon:yes stop_codon:yes gene_type:complete
MPEEIKSPCISVCSIDEDSGFCVACNRTSEEIEKWGLQSTTDEWKIKNLKELKDR